jgi:hypothetical protein
MQSTTRNILIVALICLIGIALGIGYFAFRKKEASLPAQPELSATPNLPPEPAAAPAEQKTAWQTYNPAESTSNNVPAEATEAPVEQNAAGQRYNPAESTSNNVPAEPTEAPVEQKTAWQAYKPAASASSSTSPDNNAEQSAPEEQHNASEQQQKDQAVVAAQEDDQKNINKLVQSLQHDAKPGTLEVIMGLGHDKILPIDAAAKAAYGWAKANKAVFNQEECTAYLLDPERSPTQRAIAAAALSAASNPAQALAVLKKAAPEEADQNLRRIYNEAIERLQKAE